MSAITEQSLFESVVKAYSADLYRFAYWLCRDRGLAEDLVQEAYCRAWNSRDQLRDADAAKAWLFTIVRREFARHCSQGGQTVNLEQEEWDALGAAPTGGEASDAVASLPQNYRQPFLLQILGGFSSEEIGTMLGCSSDAALQRISRARRTLRQWMGGEPANRRKSG